MWVFAPNPDPSRTPRRVIVPLGGSQHREDQFLHTSRTRDFNANHALNTYERSLANLTPGLPANMPPSSPTAAPRSPATPVGDRPSASGYDLPGSQRSHALCPTMSGRPGGPRPMYRFGSSSQGTLQPGMMPHRSPSSTRLNPECVDTMFAADSLDFQAPRQRQTDVSTTRDFMNSRKATMSASHIEEYSQQHTGSSQASTGQYT